MRHQTNGLVALSALVLTAQAPSSSVSPGVVGLWKTPRDGGLIRIETCGGAICGKIAESSPAGAAPVQTDFRNVDPALRDRPIDGLLIMKLKPIGPGHWGDGSIYNPDDGKTYKASMNVTGDGRLRLRGCIVAPLCRTQTWTRADRNGGRGVTAMARTSPADPVSDGMR
ncbi:MAG TPA: DUF2147 domain-containing protein [Caulobacteraceae bacterium]|jgi:uncharacterized protein (DUF2147 family)